MTIDKPAEEVRSRLLTEAEDSRRRFSRSLAALAQAKIPYHDRAPEVPQRLLDKCRLVQNRYDLVNLLPKNGVIAEIGTDKGLFARFLLDNCKPRELHIFEINLSRIEMQNISDGVQQGIVTVHEGDSSSLMSAFPDSYFDWVYIDGDHLYDGVKKDIEASAPKIKRGGYLVFNDYATWSPSSMSRCGVARAVNEFCIAEEWEFVFLGLQSLMYNDLAVRKVET